MSDPSGDDGPRHRSSPWPLLIAVGFALSEVGVLFGSVPVVVGGLLLFGGSCSGILRETEYARTVWQPLELIGILFVVVGGLVWGATIPDLTLEAALGSLATDTVALRGASVFLGGVVLVAGGLLGDGLTSRTTSR